MSRDGYGFTSVLEGLFGTSSMLAMGWVLNQTSLGTAGSGLENTTADTQKEPELAQALSFGFGIGSSSPAAPQEYVVLTLADNKPCGKVEQNAKKVYDKYDHKHVKSKDEGASMLILDNDAKKVVDDIIANSNSRVELLNCLNKVQEIISNMPETKEVPKDVKVIKLEHDSYKK